MPQKVKNWNFPDGQFPGLIQLKVFTFQCLIIPCDMDICESFSNWKVNQNFIISLRNRSQKLKIFIGLIHGLGATIHEKFKNIMLKPLTMPDIGEMISMFFI